MKKILLFVTLILFSACAYSSDWQQKGPVYVDNTTITKTDKSIQAWIIRPDFNKSKLRSTKYTYDLALIDARCEDREMAILNTKWYNNRHEIVEGITVGEMPLDYVKVEPKTNNEVLFYALCPKPIKKKS